MSSSQTRRQLQGPRPAPLTVSEGSRKIVKKPPVIVYLQSPKVIHVRPEEFRATVQRLTGNQAPSSSSTTVAANSSTQCSYSSTSSVMVADDQTMSMSMGMGIMSSEGQQTFNSGGEYMYDAGSAFGMPPMPPMPSDFAGHDPSSFYMNRDLR